MKALILIPFFLASCCRMMGQPPPPGNSIINNNLNKFEGTWRWIQGNDTLVLKLKKYHTQFNDYSEDVLMGCHKYVKNGAVIEDALNRFDSIAINEKKRTALLYQNQGADTSKLIGSIKDLTKKKLNDLHLQFVNGSPTTIIWHLETAEGSYIDPNFQYGLTMPKDIILTKQ